MKYLVFPLLLLAFASLALPSVQASDPEARARLMQQIEILRQEVSVLQALLANMQSAGRKAEITAQSYRVVNLADGSVALDKNSSQPYPIASVTKLMGAVVALESVELSQTITLTEKMLEPLGHSPALFRGLSIKAEDLLKATLIQSANDAAESLAYMVGKETFVGLMNQKATELGMTRTVFYDAHGLNPANRSTASDLAKLAAYIYKTHPAIFAITRDNNFWLPDAGGRALKFQNVNNFYPLASFVGGKTGYLPEAKQTLASVFRVNGDLVAVIVLFSDNRQADTFGILSQLQ